MILSREDESSLNPFRRLAIRPARDGRYAVRLQAVFVEEAEGLKGDQQDRPCIRDTRLSGDLEAADDRPPQHQPSIQVVRRSASTCRAASRGVTGALPYVKHAVALVAHVSPAAVRCASTVVPETQALDRPAYRPAAPSRPKAGSPPAQAQPAHARARRSALSGQRNLARQARESRVRFSGTQLGSCPPSHSWDFDAGRKHHSSIAAD